MEEYLAARFLSTKEVGLKRYSLALFRSVSSLFSPGVKQATCLHMPAWASFGIKKARKNTVPLEGKLGGMNAKIGILHLDVPIKEVLEVPHQVIIFVLQDVTLLRQPWSPG